MISIHALRKESDERHRHRERLRRISIHALRKESDRTRRPIIAQDRNDFNPRSP